MTCPSYFFSPPHRAALPQVRRVFRESNVERHESLYSDLTFPWLLPSQDPARTYAANLTEALRFYQVRTRPI